MKKFIVSLVMIVIIGSILAIIAGFSLIMWKELTKEEMPAVEEFVSRISSDTTVEKIEVPDVIEENTVSGILEAGKSSEQSQVKQEESNVTVDNFLYNQLNEASKRIYILFEENREQMKTGTAKIDLGEYFTDLLDKENGDYTSLRKYYQSAVEAFTYDNPEVFYLDPSKMLLAISTKEYTDGHKEYLASVKCEDGGSYLIDEFKSKRQVDEALDEIEVVRSWVASNRTGDAYQDIKNVHDYLVKSVEYDESISAQNIYNMYGALVNKYCVCEGYARAYKYLLEEAMGVPCILAVGVGTNSKGESERHAWNYVYYSGRWYAVDVTWDDPIAKNGAIVTDEDRERYFMKRGSEFNDTHKLSTQFTENGKNFKYPDV